MKSLEWRIRGPRDNINFNFCQFFDDFSTRILELPEFFAAFPPEIRRNRWKVFPPRIIERKWASISWKRPSRELLCLKGISSVEKIETYFSSGRQLRWNLGDLWKSRNFSSFSIHWSICNFFSVKLLSSATKNFPVSLESCSNWSSFFAASEFDRPDEQIGNGHLKSYNNQRNLKRMAESLIKHHRKEISWISIRKFCCESALVQLKLKLSKRLVAEISRRW